MDTARAADRKLAIATNPGQKATGARVLADMLAGYGVSHVFMVPAVLRRTMAELERRTAIHRIQTHGEKAAAYMADGYARACGRQIGRRRVGKECRSRGAPRSEEKKEVA